MESIFTEITIKKRNWGISFAYRPSDNNKIKLVFEETFQSAKQPLSKFGNIIIAGDFHVDTGYKDSNKSKKIADFSTPFHRAQ